VAAKSFQEPVIRFIAAALIIHRSRRACQASGFKRNKRGRRFSESCGARALKES
jgi:hypothetical protein